MGSGGVRWMRSPQTVALLACALLVSLVLGVAFLAVQWGDAARSHAMDHPADPMSDDESAAQVIDAATSIVANARLHDATGGYIFVSCKNEHDPPYQAAVYMNFAVPQTNSVKYLRQVAQAMTSDGWQEAASMGEHFGRKLTKGRLTVVFYRNFDDPGFATMRIYGECRNMADHRRDNPAWTELTDRLARRPG